MDSDTETLSTLISFFWVIAVPVVAVLELVRRRLFNQKLFADLQPGSKVFVYSVKQGFYTEEARVVSPNVNNKILVEFDNDNMTQAAQFSGSGKSGNIRMLPITDDRRVVIENAINMKIKRERDWNREDSENETNDSFIDSNSNYASMESDAYRVADNQPNEGEL